MFFFRFVFWSVEVNLHTSVQTFHRAPCKVNVVAFHAICLNAWRHTCNPESNTTEQIWYSHRQIASISFSWVKCQKIAAYGFSGFLQQGVLIKYPIKWESSPDLLKVFRNLWYLVRVFVELQLHREMKAFYLFPPKPKMSY